MKPVKLFERFISESSEDKFDIAFKNAKWDWQKVKEDPVFAEIASDVEDFEYGKTVIPGGLRMTRDGDPYISMMFTENMKKFIEYVKGGTFDTQYKTGSFLIRNTRSWAKSEVTSKQIKNGWSPFGDEWDVNPEKEEAAAKAAAQAERLKGDGFKAKDVDTSKFEEVTKAVQAKMAKKYEAWEHGVIRAWGNIFYLDYHSMSKSGKTQSLNQLKKDFATLQKTNPNSSKYEELQDWFQEYGKRGGVPLFNKKVMDDIFLSIAKKTPAPFDFIIYRTSNKEQDGVNSYTAEKGAYLDWAQGHERAYLIPKGTPVIFADLDADDNEIIWMPTKAQLKKHRIV